MCKAKCFAECMCVCCLWAYQSFIDIQDASECLLFLKLFTITIVDLSAAHLYKQCSDIFRKREKMEEKLGTVVR